MDGQMFDASFDNWPPPERLFGIDIHRDLCGSYELSTSIMAGPTASSAVYRLRNDEDHQRIEGFFSRYRIMRRLKEPEG